MTLDMEWWKKRPDLEILLQVHEERLNQQGLGYGPERDKEHSPNDWLALLARQIGLAAGETPTLDHFDPVRFRRQMLRTAAVAVAAIEALDGKYPTERKAGHIPEEWRTGV